MNAPRRNGIHSSAKSSSWRRRDSLSTASRSTISNHGKISLCETDKFLRFRSGDLDGARLYAPGGKARPPRARKPKVTLPTPASFKPTEPPSALPQPAAVRPPRPVIAARDSGPHVLHRDIETRGVLMLGKVGAHRYARDPRTEILCVAYAVDNEPMQLWLPGDAVPPEFIEAAKNPNWLVVAHNAAFEREIEQHILGPRFGWPLIPIERQRCTMVMALALSLPAKLENVARALALRHQKDDVGHRLMLMMAKPRKARGDEDPNRIYWFEDPDRLGRLYEYVQHDVETERELYTRLPSLSASEQALWIFDAIINQRGFCIDRSLAEAARKIAIAAAPEIDRRARRSYRRLCYGRQSGRQTARVAAAERLRRRRSAKENRRDAARRRRVAAESAARAGAPPGWRSSRLQEDWRIAAARRR